MKKDAPKRGVVELKVKVPRDFVERFDEAARLRGCVNRGEAIRDAMQRYMEALMGSQTTHVWRLPREPSSSAGPRQRTEE